MSVTAPATWQDDLAAAARPLAAAMTAGFIAGLTIGGVGGRLAMFVLRLTSDPNLRGLETDDGFTIGVFSSATLFLLVFTALEGMVGGILYLAVRSWLPRRARPWVFGVITAVVGGALIMRPNGIDFTLLEPLGLAVAMFIALPAAYGVAVSLLAERLLLRRRAFGGWRAGVAGLALLLPLGVLGPLGLLVSVALLAIFAVGRGDPRIRSLWTSTPVVWIGRAGLLAVGALVAASLVRDVTEIL